MCRILGIAESAAGRDKGKLFLIIGEDEGYVILVDGKSRSLSKPKRKKYRHIRCWTDEKFDAVRLICGSYVETDREIRRALAVIKSAMTDWAAFEDS